MERWALVSPPWAVFGAFPGEEGLGSRVFPGDEGLGFRIFPGEEA